MCFGVCPAPSPPGVTTATLPLLFQAKSLDLPPQDSLPALHPVAVDHGRILLFLSSPPSRSINRTSLSSSYCLCYSTITSSSHLPVPWASARTHGDPTPPLTALGLEGRGHVKPRKKKAGRGHGTRSGSLADGWLTRALCSSRTMVPPIWPAPWRLASAVDGRH